jgi:PAS domain S-box-containing protein
MNSSVITLSPGAKLLDDAAGRFRALVEATSALTWSCPPSGLHVEPQPRWMAFTGQTASEMLGDGWTEAVHPEDAPDAAARWAEAVARGEPFLSEHRIRRHDGAWRWLQMRAVPIRDAHGAIVEWFGAGADITEQRAAEARLRHRNRQLDLLGRVSRRLLLSAEPEAEMLRAIFDEIGALIGVESHYHFRLAAPRLLGLTIAGGVTEEEERFFATMKFGEMLCGRVAETQQRLVVEDLQLCDEPGAEVLRDAGALSYAGFPLVANGRLIGTLAYVSRKRTHFAEGDVLMIQAVCDQIAVAIDRARHETEARTQLQEIETIYASAHVGLCAFDRDLRYRRINDRLAEINGVPAADHIGRTVREVVPALADAVDAIAPGILAGRPVLDWELSGETAAQPGVTRHWVEQWTPLRDGGGGIVGINVAVEEVTEGKRAEAALRAAHNSFRQLIENSPFGIYAIDADFRIALVGAGAQKAFENVRPLIGRDLGEALRILWPEPFASEAIARFRRTLETGEPYHAPNSVEKRADIEATEAYDWKTERVTMPDGRFGVVCHFYDLTERQRHADHVQLLLREVNHRSKNLMAVAQAIARQTATKHPQDFLKRFSARLNAMAASQDLLVNNDWRSVDLAELVGAQLSAFADAVSNRIAASGPPLAVAAAAAQTLGMALHELATNATKYGALSTAAGQVQIRWDAHADEAGAQRFIMSWTEKNGPPVRQPQRTGFGTSVIVKMVKASLGCEPDLQFAATGLRWRIDCPADRLLAAGSPPPAPSAAAGPRSAAHKPRILVVEDEPLVAMEIAATLEEAGYEAVGPAHSVDQALALLASGGCDAAVLDVRLGEETSEPVAMALREAGAGFVVLSGYSREQIPAAMRDAPLLGKPLRSAALLAEIAGCVGGSPD